MSAASNCIDCRHSATATVERDGFIIFECKKGHKPRFYGPKSPTDTSYGWKRRCADFVPWSFQKRVT